jgi:hypothetical protein
MAAYALLNAFSGFEFDLTQGKVGFNPLQWQDGRFRCFWSLESGWGEFMAGPGYTEVRVLYGGLDLQVMRLPYVAERTIRRVMLADQPVDYSRVGDEIHFTQPVRIAAGQTLRVAVA